MAQEAPQIDPAAQVIAVDWRSSSFSRNVLKPAYLAAGWRDSGGNGEWTWHSLRHVFCTTAGVLDRARTATQ